MITLLSTGSNAHGQLGNGTLDDSHIFQRCSFTNHPPNSLPRGTSAVLSVVSGANHTLVLLESIDQLGLKTRELWGCGDGRSGQLGKRYKEDTLSGSSTTKFRKIDLSLEDSGLSGYSCRLISASWETSYVVLSCAGKGDVVISMGSDDFGDLGVGGGSSTRTGNQSAKDFHVVRFDHLSTPSGIRITPAALRVESITSGQRHTIVHIQISEPVSIPLYVGWGTSRHGQLGQAPLSDSNRPTFTSLPRVIEVDDIVSSALGIHHSLFLHASSGQISALGSNRKGQLQLLPLKNVRKIGCTWNGSYAVVETNEEEWRIHCSGSNSHGQLGLKTDPLNADILGSGVVCFSEVFNCKSTSVEIACGSEHVLVLSHRNMEDRFVQHVLWGWGWNEHGNLGTGNTDDTPLPFKIWSNEPDFGSRFEGVHELIGIWAGVGTSWICCSLSEHYGRKWFSIK
ncbi:RCC1/BLIP-II [Phlegmacium glaucopus]|nr:RCC1/BLIP-II [Phlegmacium glaucopus]